MYFISLLKDTDDDDDGENSEKNKTIDQTM